MNLKKNKKGVELTLNLVIVGIIVLVVLALVIFIFTKYMGQERDIIDSQIKGVEDCEDFDCDLLNNMNKDSEKKEASTSGDTSKGTK